MLLFLFFLQHQPEGLFSSFAASPDVSQRLLLQTLCPEETEPLDFHSNSLQLQAEPKNPES